MDCHAPATSVETNHPRLVLVGHPNVGKSLLFHLLTGRYVTVSNYPGTTVEWVQGNGVIGGTAYRVYDTPGVNSLHPMSEDERVARDILLHGPAAAVVQVSDAKNLGRTLFLTSQLAEFGLPLVLNLNLWDEALDRHIGIDTEKLSRALGIRVVPTIATQRYGTQALMNAITEARPAAVACRFDARIEEAVKHIEALLPISGPERRGYGMLLLAGDTTLKETVLFNMPPHILECIEREIQNLQGQYPQPLSYVLNQQRQARADELAKEVSHTESAPGNRWFERVGRWSMHPFWGVPLLLMVLYTMWLFVGKFGASTLVGWLENDFFGAGMATLTEWIRAISPMDFMTRMLVGEYGVLTMALTYSLAIILPVVTTFFLFFGLLEDSGYLPRLSIMSNRLFRKIGLNGRAVLPMVLGLGCDTMATFTTRVLETRRERILVTLLLALGVPCSAQLAAIFGLIGSMTTPYPMLIWLGTVLLVMIVVGFLASKILPGDRSDFFMEIPPIRIPKLSNIVIKTAVRLRWYISEAVPLFILGTLFLFALSELNWLVPIQNAMRPLVHGLLGLPAETAPIFVLGFLRRDYGAAGLFRMNEQHLLSVNQIVVTLVVLTLFLPCVAQFLVMIKEQGWKVALGITALVLGISFTVGAMLNLILTWTGIVLM